MDNSSEELAKLEHIKAEKEKAARASAPESKANLASLDVKSFAVRKGLSNDIEAYRVSSEKTSNIALASIALGVIADAIFFFMATHLKMGLADTIPHIIDNAIYTILVVAPALAAVFAIVEAVYYMKKTGHKLTGPITNSIITILIYVVWQSIRLIIAGI